jgi:hypothetical protein
VQEPLKVFGTITRYVLASVACLSFFQFLFFISSSSDEAQYKAGMAIGRAVICGVIAGVWIYRASREKQLDALTEHSVNARLSTATEKPIPTEQPKVISTHEPPQESYPSEVEANLSQAPEDPRMACGTCGKQFSGEFSFCPYCGKSLDAKPSAGIESPSVPAVERQSFTNDPGNQPESVESPGAGSGIQTGTIVFGAFSAISLVVSIVKGVVPIFLLEAAGWAGAAWYWQSKKTHSETAKGIVILLAIVVAVGELIHIASQPGSKSTAPTASDPFAAYGGHEVAPAEASAVSHVANVEEQAVALFKQKQYKEARPLFEQACNGTNEDGFKYAGFDGEMKACNYLGYLYAQGLGGAHDTKKAREVYKRACDQGTLPSCASLGSLYQDAGDDDNARKYFQKACDGGVAEACGFLRRVQ